jgi:outer membrane protein OmpA-like peptidoglycan-associated protein
MSGHILLRRACVLLVLAGVMPAAFAQAVRYTTENKRAIKLYEDGAECMRLKKWSCAEDGLNKAAGLDPGFLEPRLYLAEMYEQRDRPEDARKLYAEVLAVDPRYFPPAALHLADLEFAAGELEAARGHYQMAREVDKDPERRKRAAQGLANCDFTAQAKEHPVHFDPVNLGPGVNTANAEYFACVTADDATLMFTRLMPDPGSPWGKQEDFYVSHKQADGNWAMAKPITSVNTPDNEGAGTLTPDGRFIVFTKCPGIDGGYGKGFKGMGSCDLFISRRIGDTWTPAENLGSPVNTPEWESQPSMGSDGRTLYFIRANKAGRDWKSMDIYVAKLGADGHFGKPELLGENVNTPGQEQSVQIHPDGRTLYFSSDGWPGMGGADIFVSRMQADGSWGKPVNLGSPINTAGEDNSALVGSDGRLAYIASNRPGGQGDLDLYSFELPEFARAEAVGYVRGKVTDARDGKPVEADVELYELGTGRLATAAYSDPKTGEFLVCLPRGHEYALNASAQGYLFYSRNYSVAQSEAPVEAELDVRLDPVAAGGKIQLRNIFFATASHELLPASTVELEKLVKLLEANPQMRIELGGHTDNVGHDADNLRLSEQRAQAVRDFLLAHGIAAGRVQAKGYGELRPVADNATEEGRALNRRTEATVL